MTLKVITGQLVSKCGLAENKVFHLPASDVDQYGISKTVIARYSTDAAQSIPDVEMTVINFEDVTYDPDNLVTVGAAWNFLAPEAGYYMVSAMINFTGTATWADTEVGALAIYKNGIIFSYLDARDNYSSASSVYMTLEGSDLIYMAAGDRINVRVWQASGAALALRNLGVYNHVAIWKI